MARVSARAPEQLGLLPGFDAPAIVAAVTTYVTEGGEVVSAIEDDAERRAVSAEREMLAAQAVIDGLAIEPPEIEGWREELGRPRPRIVAGVCSEFERWRRLEDGSIGPCGGATCPRNLLLDRGEPVVVLGRVHHELLLNRAGEHPVMGRRPALAAVPTDGERDRFDLDAIERVDELPDTCERDVIARYGGEVPVEAVAAALGVSEEQVRIDTLSAAAKLGLVMVNGEPTPGDFERVERILRELSPRRPKIRRTWRGKVAAPTPVPRAIVREERAAPPVREPSAGEIFTF